jgi:selenoprotein W-related protein
LIIPISSFCESAREYSIAYVARASKCKSATAYLGMAAFMAFAEIAIVATMTSISKPNITITYCTQCRWLLRAAWLAQELLSSFEQDIGQVNLQPLTGGVFVVTVDGFPVWDRKRDGGFPDAAELKRRVRDRIAPDRDLGHIDHSSETSGNDAD